MEFVTRRDFHESQRMEGYRLEFAQADFSLFQHAFAQLLERGIEVTSLAAVREQDPHYVEQFYELFTAARDGWPDPDPDPAGPVRIPLPNVKRWLDEAEPAAFFIAKHEGALYCLHELLQHWHGCSSGLQA
jgi:hypothetical protein